MTRRSASLNIFQKTVRLWDTLHPYNAAQAMELAGDFSSDAVATAFNAAVRDLGLGVFVCTGSRYAIETLTHDIEIVRPTIDFAGHMTAEMNRPFPADRSVPFRPFDMTDDGRRIVGLTYQHWVADSLSIRLLMRQWLRWLTGDGGLCPVRLPSAGLLRAFGPSASGWSVIGHTTAALAQTSRMKRMRRMEPKRDTAVAVIARDGENGLIEAVKARAKSVGATVGDVLLAAGAVACDAEGPTRPTTRRPDLSMGTIVDLRARSRKGDENVFGFYLGFTSTPYRAAELRTFDGALARTRRERLTSAARKSAEASQVNLALGYVIGRAIGPTRLSEFYRKRFALSGGLSSVNMSPGWAGAFHPTPLAAYRRVSPTGPMLPLVMTPTTLGPTLQVCCTYRSALIDHDRAGRLMDAYFDTLRDYAERG